MTPKEKAVELTIKFSTYVDSEIAGENSFVFCKDKKVENSKNCALICVDEILNEFPQGFNGNFEQRRKEYWNEVKQEIEKL